MATAIIGTGGRNLGLARGGVSAFATRPCARPPRVVPHARFAPGSGHRDILRVTVVGLHNEGDQPVDRLWG
jgi:hypothetical protein